MQARGSCERILSDSLCSLVKSMIVVRANKARKLVGIILVAVVMSVSAASPAHASGEDAATDAVCDVAYYFYPSYYSDYCAQSS